ncbi:MAG: RagB/SusD family nutrient uptake outer membrane protein [Alistipes sp.]|nr:RagB/SusD family nutrient uptake outer membrane protein [Alistipes sp.]
MKKIYSLLLALFALSTCSLEEDTSGFSSPETFYKDKTQCVAGLNSCYIPLNALYTHKMMLATEGVTDLCTASSTSQDAYLDISPSQPRFGADVWTNAYKGVMYCNAVIAGIERSPIDDEVKIPLLGEGKILRAFYYWLLTSFFGDVPFYTVDVANTEILSEVGRLPRMSAVDTRNALIEDLLETIPFMEQIRTSDIADNRCGAAMGWMLIAKMAMWNKLWDTALDALDNLEAIYGDLEQYPLSDVPFRIKNTPESIFEIQHTYTAGGLIYTSNVACICMPRPREENTAIYSGVEIPELGSNATTWAAIVPTKYFYNNLQPDGSPDKRRDMNIVSSWNGETFTGSKIYFGPKFWCYGMTQTYDSNNYPIFRYADAVLMKAECLCMQEEDAALSIEYLNKVKRRAGITEYTHFRTWVRLMDEIMTERARELFGEFQRKFDLVRWGNWYYRTTLLTDSKKVLENILPCHEYYPIPDTEVTNSGYALDNNAYAAYGL